MKLILVFIILFLLMLTNITMARERRLIIENIQSPVGMVYDTQGNLYVSEWGADKVSRFDKGGTRTTVVEGIQSPSGLVFDNKGNLLVASYADGNIYQIKDNGILQLIASGFSFPTGFFWTKENTLLVANRNAGEIVCIKIRNINSLEDSKEKEKDTYPIKVSKEVISKGHSMPVGITQTDDGTLYVSCYGGSIDRVNNGSFERVNTTLNTPGVGIIAEGNSILVVDYGGTSVFRIMPDGLATPIASNLRSPAGLTSMPNGDILVGTWADNAAFSFTLKEVNGL